LAVTTELFTNLT